MLVNVFITQHSGEGPDLLVLPYGPTASIPRHLQGLGWRHLAVTGADDRLLGATGAKIRAALNTSGYAVVKPTG